MFYTGKGDSGASTMDGKKYDKSSPGIEALGKLDELNSLLGVVRNQPMSANHKKMIRTVQEDLFIIQAIVYFALTGKSKDAPLVSADKIKNIEAFIDAAEKKIQPERGFVITGDTPAGAWLDLARAVSRTAERAVVSFSHSKKISLEALAYLNRLSSLFFAMARLTANTARKKEKHPDYK